MKHEDEDKVSSFIPMQIYTNSQLLKNEFPANFGYYKLYIMIIGCT